MGFALEILYFFFGWIYFIVRWLKDKHISDKFENYAEKQSERCRVFTDTVANVNYHKIDCTKDEADMAYDEAVDYLESAGLDKSFADDLRRDRNCRMILPKIMYIANKGKLTTYTTMFEPLFISPFKFGVDPDKVRVFYKWFDYKINSFHPQYYMVRYENGEGRSVRYEYNWNVFVWNLQKNRKKLSEVSFDELIENKVK